MKLADFLFKTGRTPRDMRRELGIRGRSTVTRWCTGERIPTPSMIGRIERWSKGEVTLHDFLDRKTMAKCAQLITLPNGKKKQVFPWSNRDADLDSCGEAVSEEDPEGDAPSMPVQEAIATLGAGRVTQLPNQQFMLDGKPTDPRGLVAAANRQRAKMGLDPIEYLGGSGVRR